MIIHETNIELNFLLDDKYKNITILMENKNSNEIGIFDPRMYYYTRASKIEMPNLYRYFSEDDYREYNNVGICLQGCNLFDENNSKKISSKNDVEIINCFEDSPLAENGATIVKNLFAMEEETGNKIYLDSTNSTLLNDLEKIFLKRGYEREATKEAVEVNLFKAIQYGLMNKYSFYLIVSSLTLLLFDIVISYVYFMKLRKRIEINYIYGSTKINYFKNYICKLIVCIIFICTFVTCCAYLLIPNNIYLSIKNILLLLFIFLLYYTFIYILFFCNIKIYSKRRNNYVR